MAITLGTCPDSWGVWFADDPKQIAWSTCLDQMKAAGYDLIELGPRGYLPTDVTELASELRKRSLRVSATFVMGPLESKRNWPKLQKEVFETCQLLTELGAGFLILIDSIYTDLMTGKLVRPSRLNQGAWQTLVETTYRVGHIVKDKFGLQLVFHPHAETHVEHET